MISGFGLSAFAFSTIAHTLFPGNTSDFLLILALGTAGPMVLGWFFIRPCPYPEHVAEVATENDRGGPDDGNPPPNENTRLIRKNDHPKPLNITGLALMRTIDFWVLFWIMSLCECFCRETKDC